MVMDNYSQKNIYIHNTYVVPNLCINKISYNFSILYWKPGLDLINYKTKLYSWNQKNIKPP